LILLGLFADASVQQIFKTIFEVKQLLNALLDVVQNEVLVCLMTDSDSQCHFAVLAMILACGKQKKSYLLHRVQKSRKIWSFLGLVTQSTTSACFVCLIAEY